MNTLLHLLLYTGEGSLVMVLVASAVVAVVVSWAVKLAVAVLAFAVWLLVRTLHRAFPVPKAGGRHTDRPAAKA